MKRNWPYYIIAFCLALLTVYVLHNSGRIFPSGEVGEVYRRYCNRDDIRVEFFKDFRVNDSITVDVTTLTAKDSASWEALLREMNVSDLIIEICNKAAKKGNYTVAFYNCKKNHPEQHTEIDIPNTDYVLYSYKEYTLYVFDITSRKQRNAIQTQRIKETFNN